MLDMINKVQMFQIACNKVNSSLKKRKMDPVFALQIADQQQEVSVKSPTWVDPNSPNSPGKTSEAMETNTSP